MRFRDVFPSYQQVAEDSEAMATAADNALRLARKQKANAGIMKTKEKLKTQQSQLAAVTKPLKPKGQ